MSKGRLTIPTDSSFVEGTKKIIDIWGADAVRDCDGTDLPEHPSIFGKKVYKTYFLARGNNDFAYNHKECLQNVALISDICLAESNYLEIDPMFDYFEEQLEINDDEDSVCLWQVMDRTTGIEHKKWRFDRESKKVIISDAEIMHEYTVSFFAKILWDATQIYNYRTNNWTVVKDRDLDPVFVLAENVMEQDLEKWLQNNPEINVVRFTTFFYHFFLIHSKGCKRQKYFDWFGYAMSASPAMFKRFEEEKGYKINIEDIVDEGYYINNFRLPKQSTVDYMDVVESFVAEKVKKFVAIVHKYGKEAMMFLGDNWIGAEPYGKHFKDMSLDAVVGSVNSGATLRMLSEIPHIRYSEARFLPYFFPDTLADEDEDVEYLNRNWVIERRAIMRKPVDRIGFGGYLSLAAKYPLFVEAVKNLADEFRYIYDSIGGTTPYCAVKIAVLSLWGKKRSWMTHMVCQDAPYQKMQNYQGILEALSGLPVDVEFIDFQDVRQGKLKNYDVVLNCGDEGTSFSGGDIWKSADITSKVREYIFNGGGFIGIGEPSAVQFGGKYFQLANALGVDEEKSFSMMKAKFNYEKTDNHFITEDVNAEIDYGNELNNVYALDGTTILDISPDKYMGLGINAGHLRMACNTFGKGRCFYMNGLKYNFQNSRLIYRAMLWCARKEDLLDKAFSSNIFTECNYYPQTHKYAVINNTNEEQSTTFYDINGKAKEIVVKGNGIVWLTE